MPPRKKSKAAATPIRSRRSGRTKKSTEDEIPQIYQEMLVEAASYTLAESTHSLRPSKRRKVSLEVPELLQNEPVEANRSSVEEETELPPSPSSLQRPQQVIYNDSDNSDNDSDDDSDGDFEDVALEPEVKESTGERPEQKSWQLDLSTPTEPSSKRTVERRKPVSKAERDFRLYVHKYHLLLLLLNIQRRRHWCENDEIQAILKILIPRNLINMLHVSEEKPAFQRSHSFNKGIEEICALWTREWKVTAQGMRSAFWRDDINIERESDGYDEPSDYEEFKEAALSRSGSRDLGAILFCALLRSAAVETRLVCSLQILPFSGVAKGKTPSKPKPEYTHISAWPNNNLPESFSNTGDPSNPRWRRSEHSGASHPSPRPRPSIKSIIDSPHPIFWVEVLLPTTHIWIPLDPIVRKTINKPKTGFEPALSDSLNTMSYVIAFEDSGFAKDVTRRYTQFFNAKTRKKRVESTKGGDEWWRRTIGWFMQFKDSRSAEDDIEDDEFARRADSEPMPNNISDFYGHPILVLERHLKRNEVVWPKKERGQIAVGNKDGNMEKVYNRQNVHVVRSADQWYRRGRDVKIGEKALKRAMPKKKIDPPLDEGEEEDNDGALLYAEFQTDIYVPPPVFRGRIPKNAYGNLDVYVPSMIPPGAIHVQHPEARDAARVLGIDFTDAVTGFSFKGRQGTAIVNGIVAASEYREALVEVVQSLEHEKVMAEEEKRRLVSLQLWKRFTTALRIRAKVEADYAGDDDVPERETASNSDEDEDGIYSESDVDDMAGGFVPEAADSGHFGEEVDAMSMARLGLSAEKAVYHELMIVESPHNLPQQPLDVFNEHIHDMNKNIATGAGAEQAGGGFIIDDDQAPEDDLFGDEEDTKGGGFLREDVEEADTGGGFIPEELKDTGGAGFIFERGEALPNTIPSPPQSTPAPKQATTNEQQPSTSLSVRISASPPAQADVKGKQRATEEDEEQDEDEEDREDATSLLSEDPSDEDAEPEWLMDVDE